MSFEELYTAGEHSESAMHIVFKRNKFHKQLPSNTKYVVTRDGEVYNLLTGRRLPVMTDGKNKGAVVIGSKTRAISSILKETYGE